MHKGRVATQLYYVCLPNVSHWVTDNNKYQKKYFSMFFFWCAPFCYQFFSFFFMNEPRLGRGIDPGIALTQFLSNVGWDKIQTHDLFIVNLVCYRLEMDFCFYQIKKVYCRSVLKHTDKPVHNEHPRLNYKSSVSNPGMMAIVRRWSLFRGGC